jgi:ligand-binding SRPBCC domain-containing protein
MREVAWGEFPSEKGNGQSRNNVLAEAYDSNRIGEVRSPPLPVVFEYASTLKAEPRKVFLFHLEPKNIPRVNPWWIRVVSLESPERIAVGAQICLRVLSLGLPQTWVVNVKELVDFSGSPGRAHILDVAEKSPFPLWRHLHEFWAAPDGTTGLVDRVEFLPPGGPFGFFLLPFIRKAFLVMFRARHEATRKIFEA